MHHLFLEPGAFETEDSVRITGNEFRHLSTVLRMREGERIVLLDNRGGAWKARLTEFQKSSLIAVLEEAVSLPSEPPIKITVAQALGKGDKFEQVLQHGTEVGAGAFFPIQAERSVVEIPASKVADRLERWRSIAKGAAEQSKRLRIPEVRQPVSLPGFFKQGNVPPAALLHPAPDALPLWVWLSRHASSPALSLLIGPEGGWTDREVSAAAASNGTPVSLGGRVLRTETAALAALSQILFEIERAG